MFCLINITYWSLEGFCFDFREKSPNFCQGSNHDSSDVQPVAQALYWRLRGLSEPGTFGVQV